VRPASLQGIAKKAKADGKYRFNDVYRLINGASLYDAWCDLNKKAATGVDRVTSQTGCMASSKPTVCDQPCEEGVHSEK